MHDFWSTVIHIRITRNHVFPTSFEIIFTVIPVKSSFFTACAATQINWDM